MKGGREEGKIGGPLFPRLSLDDIQKGATRPPPRNKMAVYEPLPMASELVFSKSSSLDVGIERGAFSPFQSCPTILNSTRKHTASPPDALSNNISENSTEKFMNKANLSATETLLPAIKLKHASSQQVKGPLLQNDKAEFNNLTFSNDGMNLDSILNNERHFLGPSSSLQLQTSVSKRMRISGSSDLDSECHIKILSSEPSKLPKSSREQSSSGDSTKQTKNSENMNEDLSNTTVMGSVSSTVLTPDNVAWMIGSGHFWKVRAEIIKHQKIFSKQVFELHRIIKVQNFLAGTVHLLQVESLCSGNTSQVKSREDLPTTKFMVDNHDDKNSPLPSIDIFPTSEKGLIFSSPPLPIPTNATSPNLNLISPNMPYGLLLCGTPMMMGPTYFSPYGMLVMGPPLSPSTVDKNAFQGLVWKDSENMENIANSTPKKRIAPDDALPLFPAAPVLGESEQKTKVIRVIPRKHTLASESIAHILQSTQE